MGRRTSCDADLEGDARGRDCAVHHACTERHTPRIELRESPVGERGAARPAQCCVEHETACGNGEIGDSSYYVLIRIPSKLQLDRTRNASPATGERTESEIGFAYFVGRCVLTAVGRGFGICPLCVSRRSRGRTLHYVYSVHVMIDAGAAEMRKSAACAS